MKSSFFKLSSKDIFKGFIVAFFTTLTTGAMVSLDAGVLPDLATIKALSVAGIGSGLAYLLKNLFTNSNDEFAKPEQK
jgi:hypothetical protein